MREVVSFTQNGSYINLSWIDPTILYLHEVGNKGGSQYFTNSAGHIFMCLTSGCCVDSCLMDIYPAPTAQGNQQNYWKYIVISPHTVEYEQLASVAGMASHQAVVEMSLIGGNALWITTHSGKSCNQLLFLFYPTNTDIRC